MVAIDSRFGTPDAVTAGNKAWNACHELQDGSSVPLIRYARYCTLPRRETVMNPVTRTEAGSHAIVISSKPT